MRTSLPSMMMMIEEGAQKAGLADSRHTITPQIKGDKEIVPPIGETAGGPDILEREKHGTGKEQEKATHR